MSINSRYRGGQASHTPPRTRDDVEDEEVFTSTHQPPADVVIAPGTRTNHPVDKYYFNYVVFYLLGMTTLLPWNFFVTAEDVSIK